MDVFLHVQRIVRTVIQRALEVLHTHADYPFLRREKAQGEQWRIQLPGAFADIARRGIDHHFIPLLLHLVNLYGLDQVEPWLNEPVSITDFH